MRYILLFLIMPTLLFAQHSVDKNVLSIQSQQRVNAANRYLSLKSYGRAETVLDQLLASGVPKEKIAQQLVKLWQGTGRDSLVVDFLSGQQPIRNHRLLQYLAGSQMKMGYVEDAKKTIDLILRNRNSSSVTIAVKLWQKHGYPLEGVAICDSVISADKKYIQRLRGICYLEAQFYTEAAADFNSELLKSSSNFNIIRRDIAKANVGNEERLQLAKFLSKHDQTGVIKLLIADLYASLHLFNTAKEAIEGLYDYPKDAVPLYNYCALVEQEVVVDNKDESKKIAYLMAVVEELFKGNGLTSMHKKKSLNILSKLAVSYVKTGVLNDNPVEAVNRFEEIIELLTENIPGNSQTNALRYEIAKFTCDILRQPQRAVQQLEYLVTNPDISTKGLSICKVELGRCRIAAGDSSTARKELEYLGRNSKDKNAAELAHFYLAKLDMASHQWQTARDRLAAVAMHNPGSMIANDALDLGLLIAEELDNPVGGQDLLKIYAEAAIAEMVADQQKQIAALRELIGKATGRGDIKQNLLERAEWELAGLLSGLEATTQYEKIISQYPDGRYAAASLFKSAVIYRQLNQVTNHINNLEQLLIKYPDDLYADEARKKLERFSR